VWHLQHTAAATPTTVGAAAAVAARRGVRGKEVFEDGKVRQGSVGEAVVGDLGRDKITAPELLRRRPLFTSFWMSRTVRFTGKGIPSCKMTDRIVAT